MPEPFTIPLAFDLVAVFVFGLTGAVAAMRRGFDVIGLFALTFVTAAGGGLIRDGLFLQTGPAAVLLRSEFLLAVLASGLAGWLIGDRLDRVAHLFEGLDALGLGIYAIVGAQKALDANVGLAGAVLVGTINACGGGLLRDVLVREVPLLFKPGGFYAFAAVIGATVFVLLVSQVGLSPTTAAFLAIPVAVGLRVLSLLLGWRTVPLQRKQPPGPPGA